MSFLKGIFLAGGVIIIALRENYLTESTELIGRFEPLLEILESVGAWDLIKREVKPDYAYEYNGVIYTYRINIPGTVSANFEQISNFVALD